MFIRMLIVVILGISLTGCATSARKQEKQKLQQSSYERSQKTYQQETPSWDYEYGIEQPLESYEQPAKKTYSESVQLSAKQIQRALKNAGFYQGAIDGKIGPKTKEAIIKFQKAHNLKTDGIVGKKISEKLKKYLYQ